MTGLRPTGPALGLYTLGCSSIHNNLPYRWIFDRPSGQPHMSWFPITNSQVCKNRTGTILTLNTSITLHHLEAKLMLYIHWENPSPLFTGLATIYIYIYICMQITPFRENILVHHASTIQLHWIEKKQFTFTFSFSLFSYEGYLTLYVYNVRRSTFF
jgi:hypothetical protein